MAAPYGRYGRVYPVLQVVFENSAAFINCTSFSTPRWWKDRSHMSFMMDYVKIPIVEKSDSGVYMCQGSYPNGKTFTATSTLLVASKFPK